MSEPRASAQAKRALRRLARLLLGGAKTMSLFQSLRVRRSQGTQFIRDVRTAEPVGFRGLPVIGSEPCGDCDACIQRCSTAAILQKPFRLDLGRCIFCAACEDACPSGKIRFTTEPKLGAAHRDDLVLAEGAAQALRVKASAGFAKLFGRSLKLRQVSAGGCNACELELNAAVNVNFDAQRFGIEWVASPRHADALVLTGPLTRAMQEAVRLAWDAMPEPRFLVAVGACAISGGLYRESDAVNRAFLAEVGPSLFVPGCPPHPLTFLNAILDFLGVAG
jgi:Ni,Fe-hydrogenase III small subunit/Pyruvate/2-oxoacid:ferredoxin oxidoreductase delta subunit